MTTLAGIATGIIAARVLGPQGRGELAALTLWSATILYATTFGIGEATGYYAATMPSDRHGTLLTTSELMAVSCGILAILVTWVAHQFLATRWPGTLAMMLVPFMALYAVPGAAALSVVGFLQGTGRVRWFNIARSSIHIANLAAMLCCVAIGANSVRAFAIALLIANAVPWVVARSRITTPTLAADDTSRGDLALGLMRYGVRVQVGTWSSMANFRLDQLVLAALIPLNVLGLYVIAVTYAAATTVVAGTVALVVLPAVAACESLEARQRTFAVLLQRSCWASIGIAATLGMLSPVLVSRLFGPAYSASRSFLPILLPASMFLGINQVLGAGFRAFGTPAVTARAELIGLAVTVGGLTAFVPTQGARGAAWVSLVAYASTFVYLMMHSHRITGVNVASLCIGRIRQAMPLSQADARAASCQ